MVLVRDYRQLTERLRNLPGKNWRVRSAGAVWGYPFFTVHRKLSAGAPTVFLSGGMHGEEPAGVEGVLRWLEGGRWSQWRVNWFVLPCINPYGWERNQRWNAQRYDINRQFRSITNCPEANLIKQAVRGRQFLFSMEFHEDVEASGYYLYELRREPPFAGEKILKTVGKIVPICRDAVIDGNEATGVGLIRRDASNYAFQSRRRWPMAFHLFLNCTSHVLGSETSVRVPLEQRAAAHNAALAAALNAVL